jgi:hypothetical protein
MDAPPARVSGLPWAVLRAVGAVQPQLREVVAIRHQWDQPLVIDSTGTTAVLGLEPTAWDDVVRASDCRFLTPRIP